MLLKRKLTQNFSGWFGWRQMTLKDATRCPNRNQNCYTASIRATWHRLCRTSLIFVWRANCLPNANWDIQYTVLQKTNLEWISAQDVTDTRGTVLPRLLRVAVCTADGGRFAVWRVNSDVSIQIPRLGLSLMQAPDYPLTNRLCSSWQQANWN
jgi:hypothetical protein